LVEIFAEPGILFSERLVLRLEIGELIRHEFSGRVIEVEIWW